MKESEVLARFITHLERAGWDVPPTPWGDHPDVDARHPATGARLVAEVKGHTAAPGLDVDTGFGQLLRRMRDDSPSTRYAIVVPESLQAKVERVPPRVLDALTVEVWLVPEEGEPYRVERDRLPG